MNAYIYVEGGATGAGSKYLGIQCQKAFQKLLDNMGFGGRQPRLVACGGRGAVFDHFVTRHCQTNTGYAAMWIDSEDPLTEVEATWAHLKSRDNWDKPEGARDEQVLLMTTCMETWIVAERATLREHYGGDLQENALPPLNNLEGRDRHGIQEQLAHATRDCKNAYKKGSRSFVVLAMLRPGVLKEQLPSFVRIRRILNERLLFARLSGAGMCGSA